MYEIRANLGRGMVKSLSSIMTGREVPMENIWETIQDFGITRSDLKKLNPSYKELNEVYSAIKAYRLSVKYLKQLATRVE